MTDRRTFQLLPFHTNDFTADLSISGAVARRSGCLLTEFHISGPRLDAYRFTFGRSPGRSKELWRHSCFELFFGPRNRDNYCELNLTLDGCWNFYAFSNYRQEMQEIAGDVVAINQCQRLTTKWVLSARLDCSAWLADDLVIELGVSAVLERCAGGFDYFALSHHREVPDFHVRQGFAIILPAIC